MTLPGLRTRIESLDLARGIVMILMALDHVRDFFAPSLNPTNLAVTTPAHFATRWVTHLCAPSFFLLMGVGAFLAGGRRTRAELSRFLLVRGLWLVLLEITVLRCLGLQFNADYRLTVLTVLWALGGALVVLAGLVWLPRWAIAATGALLVAGHNALDGIRSAHPLWAILHAPGFIRTDAPAVFVSYPLVPWIGVTAIGYAIGRWYLEAGELRRRRLLGMGLSLTAGFVLLRVANVYGDPVPWSAQPSPVFTVLSFLNTTKYPPSLLFLLMTVGPLLIFLWAVDGRTPASLRFTLTYGRVPLFYFLLHLPLIHALAAIVCAARYGSAHWMFESPDLAHYPFTTPPGWDLPLPIVYGIWVLVVAALYPVCRWFAALKQRRHDAWLQFL
jgi:uncharacterized membrane protein